MRVVGIDGFKDGWVAVSLFLGKYADARVFGKLEQAVRAFPDAEVFGIDVPIGAADDQPRSADRQARTVLGSTRGRSVFDAIPPALVECATYDDARELAAQKRLLCPSRQSWALLPKMREAEPLARTDRRIHEVHPELSFWAMNGRKPVNESKRTWQGFWRRYLLLKQQGIEVPVDFNDGHLAGIDDVLDAAAAAWSARRIASFGARADRFPTEEQFDAYGRPVAIWY